MQPTMPRFATPRIFYQHRQPGWALLLFACVPVLCITTLLMASEDGPRLPTRLAIGLCVFTGFVFLSFTSLSVTVTRDALVARFGIGIVRKTVALAEIVGVEVARTRWYEGWGIRWTRRGMLYNVAGFDAVSIRLASGKSLIIGSDDAPRLVSSIRRAMDDRHARSF